MSTGAPRHRERSATAPRWAVERSPRKALRDFVTALFVTLVYAITIIAGWNGEQWWHWVLLVGVTVVTLYLGASWWFVRRRRS